MNAFRAERRFPFLALTTLLWLIACPLVAATPWQKSFEEAQALANKGDFKAAVKAYSKAAKRAGEPRLEILIGQARAYNKLGKFDDAAGVARRALPLASKTSEHVAVHSQLGTALYAGGAGSDEALEGAVSSFRRILDISEGRLLVVRFNLGLALLALERDEEGLVELQQFVDQSSMDDALKPGGLVQQAKSYIEKPRRARVNLVPTFSMSSLEGQTFNDQDLLGRVVVLDFWATWCGPCISAIPHMRRLAKRHRDDPFVLLSINNDDRLATLEKFLAKEPMAWPQIHDGQRRLSGRVFNVRRYPTYWVVDHRGEVIYREFGWSSQAGQKLDRAVAKALRAVEKNQDKE